MLSAGWEPHLGLRWFIAVAGKEMLRFWKEGNCCYNLFWGCFFLTKNSKYFISIPSENKVLDFVHYIQVAAPGWGQWLLSPHEVTP